MDFLDLLRIFGLFGKAKRFVELDSDSKKQSRNESESVPPGLVIMLLIFLVFGFGFVMFLAHMAKAS